MKTAVLLTGKLLGTKNVENHINEVIKPYNADVFIDSWIPYHINSIATGDFRNPDVIKALMEKKDTPEEVYKGLIAGGMNHDQAMTWINGIYTDDPEMNLMEIAEAYQPKMMHMEHFDTVPLTYQVRALANSKNKKISKKSFMGIDCIGTKTENVIFMWYKIWRANELRKMYEKSHRIRYDRIIRMRFDNTFKNVPVIEPLTKTLYVPRGGDYFGGLFDQFAIGDAQTMDLYCDLYNDIYRYLVGGLGIHPESLLRWHIEANRFNLIRFDCEVLLRGKPLPDPSKAIP